MAVPLAFAEEKTGVELADNVKSAILIERDTGKVLYEKNSNESVAACKYDENHDDAFNYGSIGRRKAYPMDEKVRASEYAASMGGSQIFFEARRRNDSRRNVEGNCDWFRK